MDCIEARGFTLVELVIALAIGAILMAVAAPSFTDLVRTSRLSAQLNSFARAVNFGRMEAIKRGRTASICVRSGDACRNDGPWRDGWVVFVDQDGDSEVDPEELLMTFDALPDGYSLIPNVNTSALRFSATGAVRRASGALPLMTFRLCAPDAEPGNMAQRSREIVINATGRMRVQYGREGVTRCP